MKFKLVLLMMGCMYFIIPLNAQKKLIQSSIDSSAANAEQHAINSASSKVNQGIDNLFSGKAFKKKNKASNKEGATETQGATTVIEKGKTQIIISNTNYQALAGLSDALKANVQVTEVEKFFTNGVGTLKVSHNCTSDQLLDDLVKRAGDKFDVSGMEEGKINIKMK